MGNNQFSFASMVRKMPTVESRCRQFTSIPRQELHEYTRLADSQYMANRSIRSSEPVEELRMVTSALTQMWLDAGHTVRRTLGDLEDMEETCKRVEENKKKVGGANTKMGVPTLSGSVYAQNMWAPGNDSDVASKQKDLVLQMSRMQSSLEEVMSLQNNIDILKKEQLVLDDQEVEQVDSKCQLISATHDLYSRRYEEIDSVLTSTREALAIPRHRDPKLRASALKTARAWGRYRTALEMMMAPNENAKATCESWRAKRLVARDAMHAIMSTWKEQPNQLGKDDEILVEVNSSEKEARLCYAEFKRDFNIIR